MSPANLAAVALAVACFAAGWLVEGWRLGGEIARIERAVAEQRAKDAAAAADEIRAAVQRGNDLAARTAAAENALTIAHREKADAIRRLTVGRPCLDRAAVRLLDQPAGGAAAVPAAAGQPAAADAAFATDTDVGIWIGEARRAYDTCRGRIAALADFFAQDTP